MITDNEQRIYYTAVDDDGAGQAIGDKKLNNNFFFARESQKADADGGNTAEGAAP